MPAHKAIHICNSHEPTPNLKLQKSMSFLRSKRHRKRKHIPPTKCISHWAESGKMKVSKFNKHISGLKVKCVEMPNASYM